MEWYLNIPKILHTYWGGETLSYLRYMTIKTFMKHNPDWEIMFLYPKHISKNIPWTTKENNRNPVCTDFLPEVMKLPITKIEIDFDTYGLSNEMSEVHKSDYIRLIQLSDIGGLWSDMDIFYFKPMTSLYFNDPSNKNVETCICKSSYGHSIGFMLSSKNNKFFRLLSNFAIKEYEPIFYQSLGARLYNKHFSDVNDINVITPVINILMNVVYPIHAGDEAKIIDGSEIKFTSKTIGLHWFAGHPQWQNFLTATNGGLTNMPECIMSKLIKNEI